MVTRDHACIGSRTLHTEQIRACEDLGEVIVRGGGRLHSGNAAGADQAFARGGNRVDPSLVHLHLPWRSFNFTAVHPGNNLHVLEDMDPEALAFYERLALRCHPRWQYLKQGAKKLHTRNSSIVCPTVVKLEGGVKKVSRGPVDLCLAIPSDKPGRGGTGLGMRVAEAIGVEVVDLNQLSAGDLPVLHARIASMSA